MILEEGEEWIVTKDTNIFEIIHSTLTALVFHCQLLGDITIGDRDQASTRELCLELVTSLCENAPDDMAERGVFVVEAVVPLAISMLVQQGADD